MAPFLRLLARSANTIYYKFGLLEVKFALDLCYN